MSSSATHHVSEEAIYHKAEWHAHHHHDWNGHDHKDSFFSKYIFSQDHKMIAKQFLATGIFWAIIGGLMSALFRIQLGYPDEHFGFLSSLFHPFILTTTRSPSLALFSWSIGM